MIIMIDILILIISNKQRSCSRVLYSGFGIHVSVTPDPETVIIRTRHGRAMHFKVEVATDATARTQKPYICLIDGLETDPI